MCVCAALLNRFTQLGRPTTVPVPKRFFTRRVKDT
jgi:hypothetical protein